MNNVTSKMPRSVAPIYAGIIQTIKMFCDEKLNDEYFELATKLTATLAMKRPSPLMSDEQIRWAGGVIHALGMINSLFDRSQTPHVNSKEIAQWCNLELSALSSKSKKIRNMIKMNRFDHEWCLPSKLPESSFARMNTVHDYSIEARAAPYDIQRQMLNDTRLIPHIPVDNA